MVSRWATLMRWRFGPWPVFWVEIRAVARRRRGYVARVAFVATLLLIPVLGMFILPAVAARTNQVQAMWLFGRSAYAILAMIQVTAVLLAAPAAAADAFGRERPRGPLGHLLVTDLSALEIVIGTAAARLVPVVMLLMAVLPVAMLEVVEFSVDPDSVLALTLVSLGLAVLGVAVAAALSLWTRRSYESLLGVYVLWAIWMIVLSALSRSGPRQPPAWLTNSHPYTVARAWDIFWPGRPASRSLSPIEAAAQLGVAVLFSMLILTLVARRLRAVAVREPRPGRAPAPVAGLGVLGRLRGFVWQFPSWLPGPSLDGNPVLWREWRHARCSPWLWAYWALYVQGMTFATMLGVVQFVRAQGRYPLLIIFAAVGTGFGLLAVALRSAAAWSEERAAGQGGLDVLLSTPLSAAQIVRGKWWACYRPVLVVAIVPTLAAVILAVSAPRLPMESGPFPPPVAPLPLRFVDRVAVATVVIGQPLLYGAVVVSVGIWLATRFARPSRAVMSSVILYGMVALVWPTFEEVFLMRSIDRNLSEGLAAASPMAAATVTLMPMYSPWYGTARYVVPYAACWLVVAAAIAIGLHWWTVRNFDRWMGRVNGDSRIVPASTPLPRQKKWSNRKHGERRPARQR